MIPEQFARNMGVLTECDHQLLKQSTITIAGCGCIGGFTAELLTRLGVGTLKLADPDVFDVTNINRQCAANHETVGQSKVSALSEHLLKINPALKIESYAEGVHATNVDAFVAEADYIVDAIDYFAFHDAVRLHRAARRQVKPIITAAALGFGATVLAFAADGMTLEEYVGIPQDCSIDDIQSGAVQFPADKYSSQLPSYATPERVSGWLKAKAIPTISVGQALGPGMLVSVMLLHILGRQEPSYVPKKMEIQFESP